MAIKSAEFGGSDWADGNILYAADLLDTIEFIKHAKTLLFHPFYQIGGVGVSLVAHSASTWTAVNGSSSRRTTDGGATWADCATDVASCTLGIACRTDKTKAIKYQPNTATAIAYTTDSGNNWTAATTIPAGSTGVMGMDFPSTTLAVAGLDRGTATNGVIRSTDGGDVWAHATTAPVADCGNITMFDTSTGYMLEAGTPESVWKTTDGGVNWTDTTHNIPVNSDPNTAFTILFAVSATKCLYYRINDALYLYDNTAGTFTEIAGIATTALSTGAFVSNFVKTSSGNIYFAVGILATGSVPYQLVLYKTADSGTTWTFRSLPPIKMEGGTQTDAFGVLVEYDTNKLALIASATRLVMTIDETYT